MVCVDSRATPPLVIPLLTITSESAIVITGVITGVVPPPPHPDNRDSAANIAVIRRQSPGLKHFLPILFILSSFLK
jgi:hypothetical protein